VGGDCGGVAEVGIRHQENLVSGLRVESGFGGKCGRGKFIVGQVRAPAPTPEVRRSCTLERIRLILGAGGGAFFAEAFAAQDGSALSGAEGDRGRFAALRAHGLGFDFGTTLARGRDSERGDAFGFTGFAAFGFVAELFIVEEQLFSGGEDEVAAAVNALQHSVLEFH
jgi:hypothetical protein